MPPGELAPTAAQQGVNMSGWTQGKTCDANIRFNNESPHGVKYSRLVMIYLQPSCSCAETILHR
jgi:hypothetical protein